MGHPIIGGIHLRSEAYVAQRLEDHLAKISGHVKMGVGSTLP